MGCRQKSTRLRTEQGKSEVSETSKIDASLAADPGPAVPTPDRGSVTVEHLGKRYVRVVGREIVHTEALTDVSLTVGPREFVSLIGPSGCGKTTVLKVLAGLVTPTSGTVRIAGADVVGPGTDRATVFQQAGLMPWKTVLGNIELALEFAGIARTERKRRSKHYLDLVGLQDFSKYYPTELSGGMQQRVGIARALALETDVLLMDEPFGALDAITRTTMQTELLRIWSQEKKSVLFVTHSIEEALLLSDRVAVMKNGEILETVTVPLPRPRDRADLIENPEARKLTLHLESML